MHYCRAQTNPSPSSTAWKRSDRLTARGLRKTSVSFYPVLKSLCLLSLPFRVPCRVLDRVSSGGESFTSAVLIVSFPSALFLSISRGRSSFKDSDLSSKVIGVWNGGEGDEWTLKKRSKYIRANKRRYDGTLYDLYRRRLQGNYSCESYRLCHHFSSDSVLRSLFWFLLSPLLSFSGVVSCVRPSPRIIQ